MTYATIFHAGKNLYCPQERDNPYAMLRTRDQGSSKYTPVASLNKILGY